MAELSTIARPYAEAAFEIAREKNALANWSGMLSLVSSVASDARMRAALASPKLGDAEKESLFLSIAGERLDADARSFVRVLIESDRIALAPQVLEIYEQRRHDAEGVATARIESALPVSDDELKPAGRRSPPAAGGARGGLRQSFP